MTIARIASAALVVAAAAFAAGCGEKPQDAPIKSGKYQGKPDTRPWEGDKLAFDSGNFKRGDKEAWESALKNRAQSQNEYVRVK